MFRLAIQAKPFIKWAGGKQSLAKQLIPLFPTDYDRYFEPFVGGGSMFFTLCPETAVINDHNRWLIDTYRAVRDNWERVAGLLDELPNTKEDYLQIRSLNPWELSIERRAAHFIYLNKTCFRGLFRVNRKGQFNVPYGAYDRRYYDPENLKSVSATLAHTTILSGDFELALADVTSRDFVYLDPPYYKLGGHSDFNRYTENQFREAEHFRLASLCRDLDSRGVRWALSNSNTEFVRHLYQGFHLHEVSARREINLKSQKRNILELLITNYAR